MPNFSISATAKKATKKAAYDMAVKLKKGDTLNANELDSLLLYFAPSAPKFAKTAIEWVAKSAATNDARFYLNFVRVQDGYAYASDGCRMHRAPSDLPTGFYCPKTLASVELDASYPRAEQVMAHQRDTTHNVTATLGELAQGICKKGTYLLHQGLDTAVFKNQLLDALNTQDHTAPFEYESYNSTYRLRGSSEFGDFVLMPMRVTP